MKTTLLILGILLGAGGVLLWQWMKPPADDPYFFLTPKPTIINDQYYSVEKPIKLDKAGECVSFIFWKVPQPTPKLLYLFPTNKTSPKISIRMSGFRNNEEFWQSGILTEWYDGSETWRGIKRKDDRPFLEVTIAKIDSNLRETVVYKKALSALRLYAIRNKEQLFDIREVDGPYGQYKVTIKVLVDMPELSKGLDFFIDIRQYGIK
ncbi:hypothetical protein [Intestinirhabdus alba]|uniref:Uncharacterized protein n=1 Tax=Intestinirhabdus alba TaxID=2899544 RepID=A0A6L6ITK2_9ENTR|nr:hypothetical protein [Intestinirhabdus alba]MTH48706.1 hypothetical protein [Intestinirhabdus alba]